MDVEAEQVEQAAAHRGEAVARNARAARGGFAPHSAQHRHLRRALAHDTIARLGQAQVARKQRRLSSDLFEPRSEEHTSELQSLMRISYAVFFLNNKTVQER